MITNRLSDESITDVMQRPKLYKNMLNYVAKVENSILEYEVRQDEETNPELLAFRLYGNGDMRWVVGIMCSTPDEFSPLPVGYVVKFPPAHVISTMIREVREDAF